MNSLCINYVNDLALRINSVSEPDDTSVLISSRNFENFCLVLNLVLSCMIKWFTANNSVLKLDKINIMKFIAKNSSHSTLPIGYKKSRKTKQGIQNSFVYKLKTK
jgi:hypothetical protein